MRGYQELKDVLVAADLEMAEQEWSDWIEGYWWARRVILRVEADQPFDVFIQRRGSDLSVGNEILANSVAEVPGVGYRSETDYEIRPGMSFRVAVKNNGSAAGDFKVSVTLID